MIQELAQAPPPSGVDFLSSVSSLSPILSLGLGGVLAVMLIKRIWIMPVGEFNDYKTVAERERIEAKADCDRERLDIKVAAETRVLRMQADLDEARVVNAELTDTIIKQVVPAVTRVAGPLSELVELKRTQQRKRGQPND